MLQFLKNYFGRKVFYYLTNHNKVWLRLCQPKAGSVFISWLDLEGMFADCLGISCLGPARSDKLILQFLPCEKDTEDCKEFFKQADKNGLKPETTRISLKVLLLTFPAWFHPERTCCRWSAIRVTVWFHQEKWQMTLFLRRDDVIISVHLQLKIVCKNPYCKLFE